MKFTTHLELHSQAIRLVEHVRYESNLQVKDGVLTLSDVVFQTYLYPGCLWDYVSRLQFGNAAKHSDFNIELFPLPAPARELTAWTHAPSQPLM